MCAVTCCEEVRLKNVLISHVYKVGLERHLKEALRLLKQPLIKRGIPSDVDGQRGAPTSSCASCLLPKARDAALKPEVEGSIHAPNIHAKLQSIGSRHTLMWEEPQAWRYSRSACKIRV